MNFRLFAFLSLWLLPWGTTAFAQLSEKLFVSEIMSDSIHPGADDFDRGGFANGDWWELVNVSDEPIDMTGFLWDDNDRLLQGDFTIFPSFVIQPKEVVILIDESESNVEHEDGFRAAWNLPGEMRILSKTFFEGTGSGDTFSRLSAGGDEINLYDAEGTLIQSVTFDEATEGRSFAYGFVDGENTFLGASKVDENGAGVAITDGSELRLANPVFWEQDLAAGIIDLDVSSAGRVEGVDVTFGGGELDLNAVCSMIAAGTKPPEELQAALAAAQVFAGDADQDGTVAFADFLILSTNFGNLGQFSDGDFDCSGDVGFADFLVLSQNFGQTVGGIASVPEPASRLLGAIAMVAMLFVIRRQSHGS